MLDWAWLSKQQSQTPAACAATAIPNPPIRLVPGSEIMTHRHGFRIYGPRFCPDKIDHIAESD